MSEGIKIFFAIIGIIALVGCILAIPVGIIGAIWACPDVTRVVMFLKILGTGFIGALFVSAFMHALMD